MERTCGRCLVEFPGVDGALLSWCNRDRFFVCGHCIPECKRLHGVTRNSVSTPAVAAALLVSFLFASFAPSLAPLAYEYSTLSAYRAMPLTPIQAAPIGQTVKISGTIASESTYQYPVALSGHEQLGKGCGWIWDEGAQFTVRDGSGVLPVTVNRYWEIADGPHPNPNRICNIAESEYLVGDSVVIMGIVMADSSGDKFLQASIVSPDAFHPLPNIIGWVIVGPFVLLCLGLWTRSAIASQHRRALHRATIQGRSPVPLPTLSEIRDPTLPWHRNGGAGALLDRPGFVISFSVLPWVLPAAVLLLSNSHTQDAYYLVGLLATLSAFLTVSVVSVGWIAGRVRPDAIAVTQAGIHIWYDRPADRYELDTFFPWTAVTQVRSVSVGRGPRRLVLDTSSGESKSLGWPSPEIRDAIRAAWMDRGSLPLPAPPR